MYVIHRNVYRRNVEEGIQVWVCLCVCMCKYTRAHTHTGPWMTDINVYRWDRQNRKYKHAEIGRRHIYENGQS